MKDRIRTAIEFLKDGLPFSVGKLGFTLNKSGDLEVSGWSRYLEFKNLSHAKCLEELNGVKEEFNEMLNVSDELREFIKGRQIEYILNYDDSGKASITICSETEEIVKWHAKPAF